MKKSNNCSRNVLLIEPVWNRNSAKAWDADGTPLTFNRTSMESKHSRSSFDLTPRNPFNRTSMESKPGVGGAERSILHVF